jgi:signal transduction histidine kinase
MPDWTRVLDQRLDRSPRLALGLSVLLVVLVYLFHHGSSHQYDFDFFYLIPAAAASRYCGRAWGLAVSALGAVAFFSADYWNLFSDQYLMTAWRMSRLAMSAANAGLCLAILVSISLLVSRLESDIVHEKEISRTKGEMLSVVSHQFSNALTSMGMAMFVLEEEMSDSPTPHQKELYQVLARNIANLKRDVENLLNEARMESGRFVLEPRALDGTEAVRSVLAELAAASAQKKVRIEAVLPDKLAVRADPDALHLILTNLIGNAIKYTPAEGRIVVRLAAAGSPPLIAAFDIEDTGIGMTRAEIDRALQGFSRAEGGKKMAPGFGIGLKTAHDMLASHGAALSIESRKGAGSRFSFTLPMVQAESPRPL